MTRAIASMLACSGMTVIELGTSMVSGPFCGQMLADVGADVIKIEGPHGDMMRTVGPFRGEMSACFLQFNRGKRSLVVDLKSPAATQIILSLVRKADVLIENFRPGVADRLGYGWERLREVNPRLIYTSINGFGSQGPYAQLPAYDMVIQGLVGFMPIQGGDGPPACIRTVIVDKVTANAAFSSILAALLHRERGGPVERIEVRMLDVWAAIALPEILAANSLVGDPPGKLPPPGVYRPLQSADGYLVGLIAQDSQFKAICTALGCLELLGKEEFSTAAKRFQAMDAIIDALERKTRTKSTAELLEFLWRSGDVAIAPVNNVAQFLDDPQVKLNRAVYVFDDPELGPVRQLRPIVTGDDWDPAAARLAPHLGEHTQTILEELGFGQDTISAWRAQNVVR
jgi:crotonobetainyl-CoA:carnitine CoA-transferase CaiB-like acyl-CoA transferase